MLPLLIDATLLRYASIASFSAAIDMLLLFASDLL